MGGTVCEGWLRKRGKVNTSFKQRWMVLNDANELSYYTGSPSANGKVRLRSIA